jgi:predicted ATPase
MVHDTALGAQTLARIEAARDRFVLITGCSGGGKSALLQELARRRLATCEEPGRIIVREETASGGDALPWTNPAMFAERAARLSLADLAHAAKRDGITVFDRGLVDAVCAMERMKLAIPPDIADAFARCRYARTVLLAPPWEDLFETDSERKHGFAEAVEEYEHLAKRLPELGYDVLMLPKVSVEARADFVAARIGSG